MPRSAQYFQCSVGLWLQPKQFRACTGEVAEFENPVPILSVQAAGIAVNALQHRPNPPSALVDEQRPAVFALWTLYGHLPRAGDPGRGCGRTGSDSAAMRRDWNWRQVPSKRSAQGAVSHGRLQTIGVPREVERQYPAGITGLSCFCPLRPVDKRRPDSAAALLHLQNKWHISRPGLRYSLPAPGNGRRLRPRHHNNQTDRN